MVGDGVRVRLPTQLTDGVFFWSTHGKLRHLSKQIPSWTHLRLLPFLLLLLRLFIIFLMFLLFQDGTGAWAREDHVLSCCLDGGHRNVLPECHQVL